MAHWVSNMASIHEDAGLILASIGGLRIQRCCKCGVGRRCCPDPALLWLQCRSAAAAPIGPLAWELSCAMDVALKGKKGKKKKRQKKSIKRYAPVAFVEGGSEQQRWKVGVIKLSIN